jgi:hypothetical protein
MVRVSVLYEVLDLSVLLLPLSLMVKALPECYLLDFEASSRHLFTMNTFFSHSHENITATQIKW